MDILIRTLWLYIYVIAEYAGYFLIFGGVFVAAGKSLPERFPWLLGKTTAIGIFMIVAGIFLVIPRERPSVEWEPWQPGMLEKAQEASERVAIDFYADWCITCHQMERYTFRDRRVVEFLNGFRRIRVDLSKVEDPRTNPLVNRFQIMSLPAIVFIDGYGREMRDKRVDELLLPDGFMERVSQ